MRNGHRKKKIKGGKELWRGLGMKMVEIMASLRQHPLDWGYAQLYSPGGAQLHQDGFPY